MRSLVRNEERILFLAALADLNNWDDFFKAVKTCQGKLNASYKAKGGLQMRQSIRLRSRCILVVLLAILFSGCGRTGHKIYGVFTKPPLLSYHRFAVLGLESHQEQAFMASYVRAFRSQPITFVERSQLRAILTEQDLLPGRLDHEKRVQLKKIYGVEAIMSCKYSRQGDTGERFEVKIVDVETAVIVGSAIVETNHTASRVTPFDQVCAEAAEVIKANLMRGGYK